MTRLIDIVHSTRKSVEEFGIEKFYFDGFSAVGSQEWQAFVRAAKDLANAEDKGSGRYPSTGDHCLLCRQTLSDDAAKFIHRLWAFLVNDATGRLSAARHECSELKRKLEGINLGYFGTETNVRRIVDEEAPLLVSALNRAEPVPTNIFARKA